MKPVLFLLFLMVTLGSHAQPCPEYARLMREGNALQQAGDFRRALNKYNAAKLCAPEKALVVDQQIRALFRSVDDQRRRAQVAERAAREQTKAATRANREAKALYWAAESDKQPSAVALRMLERAADILPDALPVKERIARRFNEGHEELFTQTEIKLTDSVRTAKFSQDGRTILTTTASHAVELWDLKGKRLAALPPEKLLLDALFSPDSSRFLTYTGQAASVWDLAGRLVARFPSPKPIRSVQFSADGTRLLIVTDYTATLRGVKSDSLRGDTPGDEWPIVAEFRLRNDAVDFTFDTFGRAASLISSSLLITIDYKQSESTYVGAVFPAGDARVLAVLSEAKVQLYTFEGTPLDSLPVQKHTVRFIRLSPDGNGVVFIVNKGLSSWNRKDSARGFALLSKGDLYSTRFSLNNRLLVIFKDMVRVWSPKGDLLNTFDNDPSSPKRNSYLSADLSPDGRYALLSRADNSPELWAVDGKKIADLEHSGMVRSAEFSPNGRWILTVSMDRMVKVWDLRGRLLLTLKHQTPLRMALFSPQCDHILSLSSPHTVTLWSLRKQPFLRVQYEDVPKSNLRLNLPDSQSPLLVKEALFPDETIEIIDSDTELFIGSSTSSPSNGERLVVSPMGNTVHLLDRQGKLLARLDHIDGGENEASILSSSLDQVSFMVQYFTKGTFSPNGKYILTFSSDAKTKLWSRNGQLLATLPHALPVMKAVISPDGHRIVTTTRDGKAHLWYTPEGALHWLKAHPDRVPPLPQHIRQTYGID
ncbi:WD40 repeat domain-containing protein [Larkinella soli]|uniref:WD40 repeat domain-containing protein n=1 Tax=Larkinella soli TaxID=1770527 RepID=UPI000FFB4147|nr:WD40 repeat domain-containing protein [Larkinella soli]